MTKNQEKTAVEALKRAVELAGSQQALARLLQLSGHPVQQPHVHAWLYTAKRKGLPAEYVLLVEKALKGLVTRYELRPDIYPKE